MSINNPMNPLKKFGANLDNLDFSNVSSLHLIKTVLPVDGWDDDIYQTISIPEILEDEDKQLIIPIPYQTSKDIWEAYDIHPTEQNEGSLTFTAKKLPETDIKIAVWIFEMVDAITVRPTEPEVNYIWWSPQMTSANTPAPYAVTAFSHVNVNSLPYCAFNNDGANTYYHSANNGVPNQYLQFDFGKETSIFGIRMLPSNHVSTAWQAMPKNFSILGSNDDKTFTSFFDNNPSIDSTPEPNKWNEYSFPEVNYRYYRILSTGACWGGSYPNLLVIGEAEFLRPESEVDV